MAKIVVLGSFNMDLTAFAPTLPAPGETVLGSDLLQSPGGKGSNQAIAAARLGADVSFIGSVGHDAFGDQAVALHESEGIDTTHLARLDTPTGTALIVVDQQGENQIAVASGANDRVSVAQAEAASDVIADADILLGQLETPIEAFLAAARIARKGGAKVLLNPAPFGPLPDEVWGLVEYLTPNELEAAELGGAEALLKRGLRAVIVTKGPKGVSLATAEGILDIAAVPAKAVDTTGAGDAFTAGLAVALAEGALLSDAVSFALRVGAYAVTKQGVLASLPKLSDIPDEG